MLHHLQAGRARVLVMGDSMMKQLHSRLVHMFRGSTRVFDYKCATAAAPSSSPQPRAHTTAFHSQCRSLLSELSVPMFEELGWRNSL